MERTLPALSLRHRWICDERGAALIHVGLAIFVLVGMTAFVTDYGVMWLSRRQAQNAADAGALAGAIARAFDETVDPPAADGLAYKSAYAAATINKVFYETGGVLVTWDCPDYVDANAKCVRVDVHRDGQGIADGLANNSTPLPTFFAKLFGYTSQKVRATATAWVGHGNGSDCVKPFAVPDSYEPPGPETYTEGSGYSLADMRTLLEGIYADARRDESKRLARAVQDAVLQGVRKTDVAIRDRGVKTAPFVVLVATEMRDALAAWPDLARTGVTCIGSAGMLARYSVCADLLGFSLQGIDNKDVLPAALFWIGQQAGLVRR